MKKPQRVALVGAGNLTDSPLARVKHLGDRLGPIKAPSFRVASRIANTLRAGHAVAAYEDFEDCPLVLVSVPDTMLPKIVADLAAAAFSWAQKAVVACSYTAGSDQLSALAELGAATGSLAIVPGHEDDWFVVEGAKLVERAVRPLIAHQTARVTVIAPSRKSHYLEALACAGPQVVPLLRKATESLRRADFSNIEAALIVEKQVTRTMRSYFRSGKMG